MALPTIEEVTNSYLYGDKNKSADLLDPAIVDRDRNDASRPTINVDTTEYMIGDDL